MPRPPNKAHELVIADKARHGRNSYLRKKARIALELAANPPKAKIAKAVVEQDEPDMVAVIVKRSQDEWQAKAPSKAKKAAGVWDLLMIAR